MKKIPSLLLAMAVLTACFSVRAEPASDASIEQLLTLMKVDKLMDSMFGQMDGVMKTALQQVTKGKPLSVDEQAIVDKQQGKMIAIMKDELNWDKMKGMYVQVYRETFTQEEVDGLIAFYKTPVGQSFVEKQPELVKRSMTLMQQRMRPMMQRIQAMTEETAKELEDAKMKESPEPAAAK